MDQNCNAKLDETRLLHWSGGSAPAPFEHDFVPVESPEHLELLLFGAELLAARNPPPPNVGSELRAAEWLALVCYERGLITGGEA